MSYAAPLPECRCTAEILTAGAWLRHVAFVVAAAVLAVVCSSFVLAKLVDVDRIYRFLAVALKRQTNSAVLMSLALVGARAKPTFQDQEHAG